MNSHEAWERQQREIERIRAENPSLLERASPIDPDITLAQVGITGLDADRPRGYLFYRPEDVCIEERCADGNLCSLDPTRSVPDRHTSGHILHGNLIKRGCSTAFALDCLAKDLGVAHSCLRHAGAKDPRGLTSQRVSIEGVEWPSAIKKPIARPDPRFIFEPVSYEETHVSPAHVMGSRFTMFVRHDGEENGERLKFLIGVYVEHGFVNFISPNAFGSRRINHKLGCLLLRGDIDSVLKSFFVQPGTNDLPLFRQARERLAAVYGDWSAMKETASALSHTFAAELRVLKALEREPKKTHQALRAISRDLERWVYAYGTWLFNRTLSHALVYSQPTGSELPLKPNEVYRELLDQDGVVDAEGEARRWGIALERAERKTRIRPEVHRVLQKHAGVQFVFSLPREADPHAFLSHFYRLHEGYPIPGWVMP